MKSRTALWDTIFADEMHWTEVKVSVESAVPNGTPTEYGMDALKSLSIYQTLIPGSVPTVGGAVSCRCELTVMEQSSNWPRMARFDVLVRLHSADEEQISEWLNIGTFYTDERSETKYGDLSITGYDGMLLYEQSWTDKMGQYTPSSWPITAHAWASIMESIGILQIDTGTVLDDTVGLVGLNTVSTVRDVLKTIASAHGGNWTITPDGKLRMIPFLNMDTGTAAIAGIAVAGIAIVGDTSISTDSGADYTFLGMHVSKMETGPAFAEITGVQLETEAGNVASAGTNTGYVLQGECEFSDSDGVADLCLSNIQGYVYKPFDASGAYLNPAAEPGDLVIIDGDSYQMMEIDWKISAKPTATISAPYEEEVDHEYTVLNPQAKTLRKALAATNELESRVYSSIEQTEASILTTVGEVYETKGEAEDRFVTVQTTVEQTRDALQIEIQDVTEDFDELRMHYRFDSTGEQIGKTGSEKSVTISNEEIDLKSYEDKVVVINQNEMLAPRKVTIPLGGSLQLGSYIWQPRSSGNLSLLWVGD